jgi:hypothetical protein
MKMLMIMAKKILTILLSSMIYSMVSASNRNCLEGSILQQELQKKQQNLFNSGKKKINASSSLDLICINIYYCCMYAIYWLLDLGSVVVVIVWQLQSVHITTNVVGSKRLRRGVLDTTFCDKVFQWLATGRWFSPGTPVSFTNKTVRHDITEILLKVALNTATLAIPSLE